MDLAASVTRSVSLPTSVEDVWRSIATADGLTGWLGDEVDLVVAPGAAGRIVDGDLVRRVVVTDVVTDADGAALRFAWWDEATPEAASTVEVRIEADGDGSRVTVTEQVLGGAVAHLGEASVADLAAVDAGWDRRLRALVGERSLLSAAV